MNDPNAMREQIAARLPNDGMRTVLDAAFEASQDAKSKLRGNTFAMAMRELITDLLHSLAPDDMVKACSWFVVESKDGRPTRAQRQRYVIQGGLSDDYVTNSLEIDLEDLRSELGEAFDALHKATHVRANTMINEGKEVAALVTAIFGAASGLLDAIDDCRSALLKAVGDDLSDEVTQQILRETIQEIDEKAGHHTIEFIWIDETAATSIDATKIHYNVAGSIDAELAYGSGSDFRKGDGATIDHNFPFTCGLTAPVGAPHKFDKEDVVLKVEDGGWYD